MISKLSINVEFIEMIGLSGSGKTTIFNNHKLTTDNVFINNKIAYPVKPKWTVHLKYSFLIIYYLGLKFPSYILKIFTSRAQLRLISKLGYRLAGYKKRNIEGSVFMKDSGVLMPFISSIIDDQLEWEEMPLEYFFNILPLPKEVFFVDIDFNEAYERFLSREIKQKFKEPQCNVSDFANAQKFINYLLLYLESKDIRVTVFNNNN